MWTTTAEIAMGWILLVWAAVNANAFFQPQVHIYSKRSIGHSKNAESQTWLGGSPIPPSAFTSRASSSSTKLDMMWLATIDSDIANIADDQFGVIFAGGIVVMFAGVFSALGVGAILNYKRSYGKIIAESYIENGGDMDDVFWNSLSEEDKVKAQEILDKIREAKKKNGIEENEQVFGMKSNGEISGGNGSNKVGNGGINDLDGDLTDSIRTKKVGSTVDSMFDDYADD